MKRSFRDVLTSMVLAVIVGLCFLISGCGKDAEVEDTVMDYYAEHPFESESEEKSASSEEETLEVSHEPVSSEAASSQTMLSSVPESKTISSKNVSSKAKPIPEEKNPINLIDYTKNATYAQVDAQINTLCEAFPDLVSRGVIGQSVQGRDINLVKLGKGEKKALIVAGIHAREHITVSFALRCIEDYSSAYYSETGRLDGYNIKELLDRFTLYIVVNCNPDGTEIVLSGVYPSTSVTVTKRSQYKANANGVNLNRNFPFMWEKIVPEAGAPDEAKYIGSAPASEPETQALMQLCNDNSFEWLLSLHIQGDCIYWSDSVNVNAGGVSENFANLLCRKYDFYKCPMSTDLTLFGGGFENWFRYQFSRPGFCVELMPLDYDPFPASNRDNMRFEAALRYRDTRGIFATMMSGS